MPLRDHLNRISRFIGARPGILFPSRRPIQGVCPSIPSMITAKECSLGFTRRREVFLPAHEQVPSHYNTHHRTLMSAQPHS
jgi:hypothetical protein